MSMNQAELLTKVGETAPMLKNENIKGNYGQYSPTMFAQYGQNIGLMQGNTPFILNDLQKLQFLSQLNQNFLYNNMMNPYNNYQYLNTLMQNNIPMQYPEKKAEVRETVKATTSASRSKAIQQKVTTFSNKSNLSKLERLLRRKEKKSKRERQRRVAINELFHELNSIIASNEKKSDQVEIRNRATTLKEIIKILNTKFQIEIPEVFLDEVTESCHKSSSEEIKQEEQEDLKGSHVGISRDSLLEKRMKKSKREKERRQNVNLLAIKLGMMLGCSEFKDKFVVLTQAVKYLKNNIMNI